ncbi:FAD-dependent oxidoreductase [Desertibacillus haloalkaliphilus]|uniref:FAD-dependent oxidoreductase n=1 Tax=Desertibacillus haloalkaliphilus TaxID=1328930 RepID=UPI001C2681D0|nr:FAD-dependent oxidoreductase [Desertibacillus haloalkaliphilus]MBU8908959.1 FAD-dependent oxidoreductase [Desertibacillus haloalkaliphilus]
MFKKKGMIALIALLTIGIVMIGVFKLVEYMQLQDLAGEHFEVAPYEKQMEDTDYDVIVVGGEPEGVAAAVAAARNGAKTLLIEQRDGLGGLFTYGMLNFLDYDQDLNGDIANAGIFAEWHQLVGGRVTFDIEKGKEAFLYLVQNEPNLTLSLETELHEVIVTDEKVTAVTVEDEHGEHTYSGEYFIDSTQDGDLAALAGAPYFLGGADIGLADRQMAVTLMMHFENVNWNKVLLATVTNQFGPSRGDFTAAWGFGDILHMYEPTQPDTRLRGLNIARQSDKSVYINALHIFETDGLDEQSKQQAIEKGKEETKHILEFLRAEFPGFEQAEIASYPSELYVRETRHFLAEYQLPITDVWEQNDHWDRIGFGSYPVDIQATSIHDTGYVVVDPIQYAIPFRSIVPLEVDQLLIASKASGYSSLAAGSARIVPTGMTAGQAAGTAAALSLEGNSTFRELAADEGFMKELQQTLVDQGALLYEFDLDFPYEGEWYYPAIQQLLTYGLLSGGHENDFQVNEEMNEMAFLNLLTNGIMRMDEQTYEQQKDRIVEVRYQADQTTTLTKDRVAYFIMNAFDIDGVDQSWTELEQIGIVDDVLTEHMQSDQRLLRAEAYHLVANTLDYLVNRN